MNWWLEESQQSITVWAKKALEEYALIILADLLGSCKCKGDLLRESPEVWKDFSMSWTVNLAGMKDITPTSSSSPGMKLPKLSCGVPARHSAR